MDSIMFNLEDFSAGATEAIRVMIIPAINAYINMLVE
jgi:hypothetical protein